MDCTKRLKEWADLIIFLEIRESTDEFVLQGYVFLD